MDAPRIQYAKTEDGVSIAFWAIGSGPVIVLPPLLMYSHVRLEWEAANSSQAVFKALSQSLTVVHYDPRGVGMSDRDTVNFSTDASSLDLEAVRERVGVSQVAILATVGNGDFPVLYASTKPERVSHLVLYVGNLMPLSVVGQRRLELIDPIMDVDWDFYCELRGRVHVRNWDAPIIPSLTERFRVGQTPASLRAATRAVIDSDWSRIASKIQVPTLILYPQNIDEARASRLAARVADCQLLSVPGIGLGPLPNLAGVGAISDFVLKRQGDSGHIGAARIDTTTFRTILFTDLADHTAMMQRLGDARGREVLREHERITRETLAAHAGTEIKAMGDGFMASFGSAQKALECAIVLQRAFAGTLTPGPSPIKERGDEEREVLRLHIGVNAGEPIAEDDDLFGSSVILAARAASKATAGQILVTNVVRELVAGKGFSFADAGEFEMKGFEEPVRLYEVRWDA
jgi:class 3 adenylate cyclase/pimeloyl-ACP methyl ester carboxylesterase